MSLRIVGISDMDIHELRAYREDVLEQEQIERQCMAEIRSNIEDTMEELNLISIAIGRMERDMAEDAADAVDRDR